MNFYEYLMMLQCSEEVDREIFAFKNELFEQIGEFSSRTSVPHITIGLLTMAESKESELLSRLEFECAQAKSMQVVIDGFSSFKSHTVFARILEPQSIRELMWRLEAATKDLGGKNAWQPKIKNPHLTIGRELGKNYHAAREYFIEKRYNSSFAVTALHVRKRALDAGFQPLAEFRFGSSD